MTFLFVYIHEKTLCYYYILFYLNITLLLILYKILMYNFTKYFVLQN